ncbi:DUF2238 domain-containing protein [Candidatus Woesearchaeota archaeon]|nr:DUF2238 domain-containing protein [Candidatus Woesearchaeota archaeon]
MKQKRFLVILGIIVLAILIWSLIDPKDYGVWLLEVFPALIGIGILAATYPKFKFTNMVYVFVAVHSILLIVGGHYTYAENPLFNWIKDYFDLTRNHYDRLGHLAQGFFPAIIIREVLLRNTKLERGKMLFFLVISVVLMISAGYELLEWGASLVTSPGTGNAFLGTQGDIWDTQWDMLLALIGAILSLLMFSKYHDQMLRKIREK